MSQEYVGEMIYYCHTSFDVALLRNVFSIILSLGL